MRAAEGGYTGHVPAQLSCPRPWPAQFPATCGSPPSHRRYARTKHPCDLQSRRGRGGGNTALPSDCDTAPAPDSPPSGKWWSSSSTVNCFAHLFQRKVFPPSDRKSNINLPPVANVHCCIFMFAILGWKLIVFESSELLHARTLVIKLFFWLKWKTINPNVEFNDLHHNIHEVIDEYIF